MAAYSSIWTRSGSAFENLCMEVQESRHIGFTSVIGFDTQLDTTAANNLAAMRRLIG